MFELYRRVLAIFGKISSSGGDNGGLIYEKMERYNMCFI